MGINTNTNSYNNNSSNTITTNNSNNSDIYNNNNTNNNSNSDKNKSKNSNSDKNSYYNNKTNIANKANKEINVEDLQLNQQDSLHLSSIHHQMVHQQKSTSQNRFYERGGNTAIKEKRNLENQRRNTPKRRKCASRVVIRLDISSESEAS